MESMLLGELHDPPTNIPKGKITPFAQAMPDEYKNSNPVIAYRQYYLAEKIRFAKWNFTEEPEWWREKNPEFSFDDPIPF